MSLDIMRVEFEVPSQSTDYGKYCGQLYRVIYPGQFYTLVHSICHHVGIYSATLVTGVMPSQYTYLLPLGWKSLKCKLFSIIELL